MPNFNSFESYLVNKSTPEKSTQMAGCDMLSKCITSLYFPHEEARTNAETETWKPRTQYVIERNILTEVNWTAALKWESNN